MKINLAESIYSRLKNVAREKKRPVQEILKYYAMERFLYRLSISSYSDSFYLKGGLMLMVWDPMSHRSTIDIDLLAKTSNDLSHLFKILQKIGSIDQPEDGVIIDSNSFKLAASQIDAEYQGVSASFLANLFTAKIPMQIDFGFSDLILPNPAQIKYPTILNLPAPQLKGYTPQTSIAEKFETIVRWGLANTRMKDFYDIWKLIQQFSFDQKELKGIILKVLKNRGTTLEGMPQAFSESFYKNETKNEKWNAFLKNISHEPLPLEKVIGDLKLFFNYLIPQ
ncbi:MAG: nucleotidyl transferase AbiEii/AbiGii toxin family protein [Parachlamydiales bacterium]|nr:nucleotidyl transferase AbiEii/AbiGii toxin family protein [Parachlamydiales bacterium]